MGEIRLNPLTREWVILAPARARRPGHFRRPAPAAVTPQWVATCPFCPGNEGETAEELARWGPPPGAVVQPPSPWQVRAVRNKFPAVGPATGPPAARVDGGQVAVDAHGHHEVLIDSPRHDLHPATQSRPAFRQVVRAYHARFRAIESDPGVAQVVAFKNHGVAAGISQDHSHSQLVGLPIVSEQVRARVAAHAEYARTHGGCVVCDTLAQEHREGTRVLVDGPRFLAVIPYAALSPFHTWILPKRHEPSFARATPDELDELADTLWSVLRRLHFGLGDPAYNFVIRSAPTGHGGALHVGRLCADGPAPSELAAAGLAGPPGREPPPFHYYVAVVPRVARAAGFELGSGMFINTAQPEESAAFLRNVPLPPEP